MNFSDKLIYVRKKLFLSQQAIANELNVSYATVNRWETGKFKPNYKAQKAFYDFCIRQNIAFDNEIDKEGVIDNE